MSLEESLPESFWPESDVPADAVPESSLEHDSGSDLAAESEEQLTDETNSDWDVDDLEAAYLRALEAVESVEWAVGQELGTDLNPEGGDESAGEFEEDEPEATASASTTQSPEHAAPVSEANPATCPPTPVDLTTIDSTVAVESSLQAAEVAIEALSSESLEPENSTTHPTTDEAAAADHASDSENAASTTDLDFAPNAAKILEACLFVGGTPLSSKRLANILEGHNDPAAIERLIDELNLEYAAQQRPYEIRLGDGGYRMALRAEFEPTRNRVHGAGPKEVKLGQDALEILALVAYKQPISQALVEQSGKTNAGNLLRQLLRRELVSLSRIDNTRNGVQYHTTPRFLQLFGLGNLSELPQADELSLR